MDEDTKTKINRIVIELSKEEGQVLPMKQLLRRAASEGISEEDVKAELIALTEDGLVTQLDETAITVNR